MNDHPRRRVTPINAVSCASASQCVAVDDAGNVLSTSDPTGPSPTWSSVNVDGGHAILGVSCPSVSLCIAVDDAGRVLRSTDPTGPAGAWASPASPAPARHGDRVPVGHAVRRRRRRRAARSLGEPRERRRGWSVAAVPGAGGFTAVTCPSTSLCFAVDDEGNEFNSDDPADAASTWVGRSVTNNGANPPDNPFPGAALLGVACPSVALCIAVDEFGSAFTGRPTPANVAIPTISGTAATEARLQATVGTWTETPTSFRHQWQRCDAGGAQCADIYLADDPTYVPYFPDIGKTIRVLVFAMNANGVGTPAASAPTAAVQATPLPLGTPPLPAPPLAAVAPPPPPPPTAPADGRATVGLPTRAGRSVRAPVRCAGTTGAVCRVRLKLTIPRTARAPAIAVGRKAMTLRAGARTTATVRLNAVASRLLTRRRRVAIRFDATQTTAAGARALRTRRFTFTSPASGRRA